MATGGVIASNFQFVNYKIDQTEFAMTSKLENLNMHSLQDCRITMDIGFRDAERYSRSGLYVVGLGLRLSAHPDESGEDEKPLFKLSMSISGAFKTAGIDRDSDDERGFVAHQGPALLFSYLRGAASSFLANAGFGSLILPLVNVYALAQNSETKVVDAE